jgi:hypothetical protein
VPIINATRIVCAAARDRSHFLLTVHSHNSPSLDIRFPMEAAETVLAQLQNMIAVGKTDPTKPKLGDPSAH